MEGHQHHQYGVPLLQDTIGAGAAAGDRLPQWSIQETRDFLMIRAELEYTFLETKRNKLLWEVIAAKMKEKGYNRSADQCKCKWKNLVTRYKGCETMETESMRQFPFYNELQGIFAARMQRMQWMESEGGDSRSKKKAATQLSSDEEDDDQNDDSEGERANTTATKSKKKMKGGGGGIGINTKPGAGVGGGSGSTSSAAGGSGAIVKSLKEILEEFTRQQLQMEMEWLKSYKEREEERKKSEMEWRQTMEALENERLTMEKRWREREEQRRVREEAKAEKRDALITALLNKLRRED